MKMLRAFALLFGILSCGCVTAWKPSTNPVPWAGPGRLAESQTRTVKRAAFVVAAPDAVTAERWLDTRHRSWNPQAMVWDAQKYLDAVGATRGWNTTNGYNDGIEERVAPFDFTFASVNPAIIVMTGRTDGGPQAGSAFQLDKPGDFQGPYLLNHFHVGTAAPYSSVVEWFSMDLNQPPTAAETISADQRIIRWPRGSLQLQRDGERWQITRHSNNVD
jgi:hypothetical protein